MEFLADAVATVFISQVESLKTGFTVRANLRLRDGRYGAVLYHAPWDGQPTLVPLSDGNGDVYTEPPKGFESSFTTFGVENHGELDWSGVWGFAPYDGLLVANELLSVFREFQHGTYPREIDSFRWGHYTMRFDWGAGSEWAFPAGAEWRFGFTVESPNGIVSGRCYHTLRSAYRSVFDMLLLACGECGTESNPSEFPFRQTTACRCGNSPEWLHLFPLELWHRTEAFLKDWHESVGGGWYPIHLPKPAVTAPVVLPSIP